MRRSPAVDRVEEGDVAASLSLSFGPSSSTSLSADIPIRRPSSFDEGSQGRSIGEIGRPHSFEAGQLPTRMPSNVMSPALHGLPSITTHSIPTPSVAPSAFSPVDPNGVPRVMVHSPIDSRLSSSPLPSHDARRLLAVPSPDAPRILIPNDLQSFMRSPDSSRSPIGEVAPDMIASMNLQSALSNLGQLNAALGMNLRAEHQRMSLAHMAQMHDSGDSTGNEDGGSLSLDIDHSGQHLVGQFSGGPLATPEMMAQMPPKSTIQEDVRNGNGRFQLVRKRGRSEVWNLFGQVLDTMTGVRLPYVACYACKVLYTDTGGGTGNMTRHRCPIGNSYRNNLSGSSTETMDQSGNMGSSFESTSGAREMKRSATPERHDSGENRQLLLAINSSQRVSSSANATPLVSTQTSGELSIGEMDKELLADAMIRAGATDLISFHIFQSRGFRQLAERLLLLGRRFSGIPPSELFPDHNMMNQTMENMVRFARDDIRAELSSPMGGTTLAVERLNYRGEWTVVWAVRIAPDWKLKQMVVGVFPSTVPSDEALRKVSEEYGVRIDGQNVTTLGLSTHYNEIRNIPDISREIERIVRSVLDEHHISILSDLHRMLGKLVESQLRLPSGFPKDISAKGEIQKWYQLAHLFRIYHEQLMVLLPVDSPLSVEVSHFDWAAVSDMESFLEPINETLTSLSESGVPTLHMVVPEWCALLHECQVENDDDRTTETLRLLKTRMGDKMKEEQDSVIQMEHRMATVLHPRLNRKLPLICSDSEKLEIYRRIREVCGIGQRVESRMSETSTHDGEPTRKRRIFLCQLEESSVTDDELESYSRSQFTAQQTRDVLNFWCTAGVSQFPALSRLARRLFAIPATVPHCGLDERTATVPIEQLPDTLILRASFENE